MIECLRLVKMQITADGLLEEGVGSYSPAEYNPREDLQPGDRRFEKIKRSLNELNDFGIMMQLKFQDSVQTFNSVNVELAIRLELAEGEQDPENKEIFKGLEEIGGDTVD